MHSVLLTPNACKTFSLGLLLLCQVGALVHITQWKQVHELQRVERSSLARLSRYFSTFSPSECPVATVRDISRIAPIFSQDNLTVSRSEIKRLRELTYCAMGTQGCQKQLWTRLTGRVGLRPFITAHIRNKTVYHDDPSRAVWPGRIRNMLQALAVAVNASDFPADVETSILLWCHDACVPPGITNVPVLAFAAHKLCPSMIPAPAFPSDHNPFFADVDYNNVESSVASVQASMSDVPWGIKQDVAVWRGSASDGGLKRRRRAMSPRITGRWEPPNGGERATLAMLSLLWPNIIQAAYSSKTDDTATFENASISVSHVGSAMKFSEFFKFKYILDVPGVGSSFRMSSLLLGNSVVVSPDTFFQWFTYIFRSEGAVKYLHPDMRDVLHVVQGMRDDDIGAREVAQRSSELARVCFTTDVLNYHWRIILQWLSKRQVP